MGETLSPVYIEEIRRLWQQSLRVDVDRAQVNFALADRLNDEIPIGKVGISNGRLDALQHLADQIGAPCEQLRKIQRTGVAWSNGRRRPFVSWSVYQELSREPEPQRYTMLDSLLATAAERAQQVEAELDAKGVTGEKRDNAVRKAKRTTVDEARKARGARPTRDPVSDTAEKKAAKVEELLSDVETRKALASRNAVTKDEQRTKRIAEAAEKKAQREEEDEIRKARQELKDAEKREQQWKSSKRPDAALLEAEANLYGTTITLAGLLRDIDLFPLVQQGIQDRIVNHLHYISESAQTILAKLDPQSSTKTSYIDVEERPVRLVVEA